MASSTIESGSCAEKTSAKLLTLQQVQKILLLLLNGRCDHRSGSGRPARPSNQARPSKRDHVPSTRRMIMSDTAMLAPPEAGDSAIGQDFAGSAASQSAVDRYRAWVSDHRVSAALLAGLVATHMATVVGYFMPGIGLPQLDWNRINGAIYTPKASPDLQFLSGGVFHYVDGIVFTLVFVVAVFPLLRWASTPLGNTIKGL